LYVTSVVGRQLTCSCVGILAMSETTSLIQDLEANPWIDEYTRAVLIEFNVLSPNNKLFNHIILLFEYMTDGSTLVTQ